MQEAAEQTLTDEELRRNGQRIDAFFVSSSHPIAPDIFELGDLAAAVQSAEERRKIERPMDPKLTGVPKIVSNFNHSWCSHVCDSIVCPLHSS